MPMPEHMRHIPGLRIALVIAQRELKRFARQPARIAGAVGTPILLWIFLASGFVESMRSEHVGNISYAAFLLPGMMSLTAVFAAVLSSMSVIEDRQAGWLQAALVSPAPRWSLAVGQVLGAATIAFAQAAILMFAVPLLDLAPSLGEVFIAFAALAATSIAMASLGIIFAWRVDSSAGFHAVMNLLFMPMWLLSGAFIPAEGAAPWFAAIVRINPLSWCTEAIRAPLLGGPWLGHFTMACAFAILSGVISVWDVSRSTPRSL
jgi:ABC-2 type transport system permease protein